MDLAKRDGFFVETAGINLTGIKTRERRRSPDQSEGGGMRQTRTPIKGSPNLDRAPLMARGTKWNGRRTRRVISAVQQVTEASA
jgi:hypothetical protein